MTEFPVFGRLIGKFWSETSPIRTDVRPAACVFLAGLHRAERAIAERLLTLNKGNLPWPWIDPDKAIPWVERRTGLTLAESQKAAVAMALGCKELVITGGPGVGKTTIVNAILRILSAKDVTLLLCAPPANPRPRHTAIIGVTQFFVANEG
jgi:exodeoxyribonuclease V alpha subunit